MRRATRVILALAALVLLAPPAPSQGYAPCLNATIRGTLNNDFLIGTSGRDIIKGRAGTDIILGLGGADILCGNAGEDELDGGDGSDFLYGGRATDRCSRKDYLVSCERGGA